MSPPLPHCITLPSLAAFMVFLHLALVSSGVCHTQSVSPLSPRSAQRLEKNPWLKLGVSALPLLSIYPSQCWETFRLTW